MTIYLCDGDTDAILTATSIALSSGKAIDETKVLCNTAECPVNYEFFAEYIETERDASRAAELISEVSRISPEIAESVLLACLNTDPERADAVYKFIAKLKRLGRFGINKLQDYDIQRIFELQRYAANELHEYKGFLRFTETENGVLLAGYEPKVDITELLIEHFADRFPTERVVIVDITRKKAAVSYPDGKTYVIPADERLCNIAKAAADEQADFERMWRTYVDRISIEERTNIALQKSNLRLRYRTNMTEFRGKNEKTD